jgi:AAA+ superfamily predicted ATPase
VDATGIVQNEIAGERHAAAWDNLLGLDTQKDQLLAWGALTLQAAQMDRTATAVNRLAVVQGPPGTGKTTLARNLASPLSRVCGADVRVIEFAAHEAMSGEHGRTQREVHRVLTEVIPELAGDDYTVLVVDEVESLAIHRGSVSLEANPVDVHRTTDAVLTALDLLADRSPNVVTVVTTNFPDLVDAALRSRADVTIAVPLPTSEAVSEILQSTLRAWSEQFPSLKALAEDRAIRTVAKDLATSGIDARQTRKFVLDVLSSDLSTAADPGSLTIAALQAAGHARRGAK